MQSIVSLSLSLSLSLFKVYSSQSNIQAFEMFVHYYKSPYVSLHTPFHPNFLKPNSIFHPVVRIHRLMLRVHFVIPGIDLIDVVASIDSLDHFERSFLRRELRNNLRIISIDGRVIVSRGLSDTVDRYREIRGNERSPCAKRQTSIFSIIDEFLLVYKRWIMFEDDTPVLHF